MDNKDCNCNNCNNCSKLKTYRVIFGYGNSVLIQSHSYDGVVKRVAEKLKLKMAAGVAFIVLDVESNDTKKYEVGYSATGNLVIFNKEHKIVYTIYHP